MTFRELHGLDLRISYADTDPAGILYFGAWFPWMERVQTEWLFLRGFRQDTLEERFGWRTITRAAECEYLAPVRLFDPIHVGLGIGHLGTTSLRWELRMTRDGELVGRGSMTLVTTDASGVPVAVPAALRTLVAE
ncbi:thioesterase family protein [Actinokineospora sp. NBRC 105648]|uniref:acyl-CoA thioesterase n=1 Tax=Actinokineospora sp. NBRC 105648 TaxID=3032206 RepID=UPI0024A4D2DF|nr:thioesterase family protein [Actinokineospora sp. NBRC 105648]GLZ42008.1 hypothetical protein Acsp05_56320 [Actinokineospora sp. NBRC 105648]